MNICGDCDYYEKVDDTKGKCRYPTPWWVLDHHRQMDPDDGRYCVCYQNTHTDPCHDCPFMREEC